MPKIEIASRASQGGRQYQEDSEAFWPGNGPLVPSAPAGSPPTGISHVAVLADGMGGHAAGDVASKTICSVFLEKFLNETSPVGERLAKSLSAANIAIREKAKSNPSLGGMGATCVGLAIGDAGGHFISVGDSPLWRFRGGCLKRLNADHSLAPLLDKLVEAGQMSADDAAADPRRHYLRSAVTGDDLELIDAPDRPFDLTDGDIVVLASDGVLTLTDEEIGYVVGANKDEEPERIADALIRAVMDAEEPYQDNTTVIIVKVE